MHPEVTGWGLLLKALVDAIELVGLEQPGSVRAHAQYGTLTPTSGRVARWIGILNRIRFGALVLRF